MPRAEPEAPPSDAVVDGAASEVETPPAAPPPAAEAAVAGSSSGGGDGASHLDAAHGDRDGGGGGRLSVAELSGNLPSLLGDEDANAELVRALSGAEAAAPERAALWQRWTAWIIGYLIVAAGLWWLMNALYFDFLLSSSGGEVCGGAKLESMAQSRLEYLVGWAPPYLRGMLLLFVVKKLCQKVTGFEDGAGIGVALLAGYGAGDADRAGWVAIVQPTAAAPQPTWAEAREARGLTQRQALSSSVAKLVLWHLSQPLAYLGLLYVYRCFVAR
eukprot:COSAG06_NODE_2381_length_6980_cov_11.893039_1_plen_273_part_00